jgi:hypothetical protein
MDQEMAEDDQVPRSYADLFIARLGRIVDSTEIATFRIVHAFGGKEVLPVSYFRTRAVSPRLESAVAERLMPIVVECLGRLSDACIALPNNRWCLVILLGTVEMPQAAATFLIHVPSKKKAMARLKLLQGAAKK